MGFIKDLIDQTGGAIGGAVGNQLGYGLGNLTGFNEKLRQDQLKQQEQLMRLQYGANYALMKNSYEEQLNMWHNTNAEAQIKHLKNAGLNPALMYAKGGAGGSTGSGGSSVGGGQASDETTRQMALSNQNMMGMAMMKMKSEIAVNQSVANKNNAEAQTTNESRSSLINELYNRGYKSYIEAARMEYEMRAKSSDDTMTASNKFYNPEGGNLIEGGSLFSSKLSTEIAQIEANTGNSAAQALLTNEKAKGYWQELLNDTARADNDKIKATATKLAAEWQTGEYTNWKTWADLARGVFKDVFQSIK